MRRGGWPEQHLSLIHICVDLYAVGLGEKIESMAKELFAGPGAVRATLHKYVKAR